MDNLDSNELRLRDKVCSVCGQEFDSSEERDAHQEECFND